MDGLNLQIKDLIGAAQQVLVLSHIRPDGDAIGSLLGFGLPLQAAGKKVQMVLSDGLPANYRFLEGGQQIVTRPTGQFDLIIAVDCSELKRIGPALEGYREPDLNVDHHITNTNFARINLVEPEAAATAEILTRRLPEWGLQVDAAAASALLTGLLTDTLGFRTSNMTAQALRTAAELMERGANLPALYTEALLRRSYAAVRLWAAGLARMEREGELVWATLSIKDRQEVGYPGRDDADLINVLSTIDEAAIAMVFVEQPNGNTKVSWRAKPGIDVSQVALQFGGGGHPAAAGAEVTGGIEEVSPFVLNATRKLLVSFQI
jgi:phosphoesterase RecJ-like protein